MKDAVIGGIAISPNVVETIAGIAVHDLDGVVCVGKPSYFRYFDAPCVYATSSNNKTLEISVHVTLDFDVNAEDVANQIRSKVASAIYLQTGIKVTRVDVYVDGIVHAG